MTVTVLIALILSSSIEMTQLFDDGRDCDASDVVLNVSGTILGVAVGYLHQHWLEGFVVRADRAKLLHPSGAMLLFYTWLGYQTFPLFPVLSVTRVAQKFGLFFADVSVTPLATFTYFVEWLVVAQLLETVLGAERRRRFFPLLLLVLPAKLMVAGRTVTWSECTGAVLAFICSYVLSGFQRRAAVVGILIVSMLILGGLAPYHWSSVGNPFSWIPFSGFLETDQEFGLLSFLRKCFWYGSAIWILRSVGWRLARAAVAVAMLLGAIEVVQIYLPGRVAEITDPLLALIMASILGLVDRSYCLPNSSFKVSKTDK